MDEASRNALPALAQGDALADSATVGALDDHITRLLSERGATGSAALAVTLGTPLRTVQYRLGRLARSGAVAQPKRGVWELTAAGRRAALTAAVPSLASLDLRQGSKGRGQAGDRPCANAAAAAGRGRRPGFAALVTHSRVRPRRTPYTSAGR